MEKASGAVEPLASSVTLAVGGGAGPSRTFTLRVGEVLRVGRGAANDFVLALGGISTCHAELFLRPGAAEGEGGADLHVRDTSKNGTGVQSCTGPVKWNALPRGGLTRLQSGDKLLLPLRGLPKEANELQHTLTVSVTALDDAVGGKKEAAAESGGTGIKAKTPRRQGLKEKKEKKAKPEDAARKRKREERDDAVARARRREAGERPKERRTGEPLVVPRKAPSEGGQRKRRKHRRPDDDADVEIERPQRRKERRRRRREEVASE